ncbi:MAG: c-type cytochrome [Planctomycetes bacterium]|nr:c-type cytochrome [Planctomycetota bacterium]
MHTVLLPRVLTLLTLATLGALAGCSRDGAASTQKSDLLARGRYLVQTMGCADCHSPHGPDGAVLPGRELSGHPESAPLPHWTPDMLEQHTLATTAPTGTAFAGPFGLSVACNLTPDPETGIGAMTADQLVASWRSGRHWKEDRNVLPPMPIPALAHCEESDIRAIHAYLHSLPPVRNMCPPSRVAGATSD